MELSDPPGGGLRGKRRPTEVIPGVLRGTRLGVVGGPRAGSMRYAAERCKCAQGVRS